MTGKATHRRLPRLLRRLPRLLRRQPAAFALFALVLCLPAAGCATTGMDGDAAETLATAPPAGVPAGFRLGEAYFSALGEQCRETFPENDHSSGPGALCLRNGVWERVPDIFLSVPAAPAPIQASGRRS